LLEPVGLSVSCVQVVAVSVVVDVQRLIVLLAFDGETLLVEVPNLALVTVWLLDAKFLVRSLVDSLEISSSWES
jgi:hypothetical protein